MVLRKLFYNTKRRSFDRSYEIVPMKWSRTCQLYCSEAEMSKEYFPWIKISHFFLEGEREGRGKNEQMLPNLLERYTIQQRHEARSHCWVSIHATWIIWSYGLYASSYGLRGVESQNGWVWKGPLKIIWSSLPAQPGPSKANWPGPCPDGF